MNRLSEGKTDYYIGTSVCIANVTPDCVSQFVTGLESVQRVFWGEQVIVYIHIVYLRGM